MLPCVCSVIDHRHRQRTCTREPNGLCATFLFSPHFDVIRDQLLNGRTVC